MTGITRLPWRRTWDDKNNDFVAYPDGEDHAARYARIYESHSTNDPNYLWRWFVSVDGVHNQNGHATGKQTAADHATAAYWLAVKRAEAKSDQA